ncbi:beta-glucosidase 1 [Cadophora sp. MPI-SDFR-AT-0126]|nr:beta-glucosidase 1 [Leotiomycetes sp. MPI-SDFR-AT-0126]
MHLLLVILVFSLNGYTFASIQSKSTSNSVNTTKSNSFIAKLNLTKKASIVTSTIGRGGGYSGNILLIPRIGFPGLCLSDRLAAVNRADLVSIFPSSEGFSPDPYLIGIAMLSTIVRIQEAGVQSCSKTNIMLLDRTNIDAILSNIGDWTLHELYLWLFTDAVKAGAASVMCSYNRLNKIYACENSALLNGTLKTELGFNGYSIKARLDMNIPGSITPQDILTGNSLFGLNIVQAVNNSSLAIEKGRDVRGNYTALIRKLGSAGTVLLKNVNSTLPLKLPKQIGVFRNSAADLTDGLIFPDPGPLLGFDIGTLSIGGGSGSGRHAQIVSPLEAIKAHVCLVFLKTFASEGRDRSSFELDWNSTAVVNNVAKLCLNTIVITHSAGVNTMPWASNPNRTEFIEGQFINYRYFDSKNIAPLYEFRFGLSYTTFDIIALLSILALARDLSEFPDRKLAVAPGVLSRIPIRVLRGFEKTNLRLGEKKDISFLIKRRDISFWDTTTQKWRLPKG